MRPLLLAGLGLLLLGGCSSRGPLMEEKDSAPRQVPVDPWQVPEPQPRHEPRSRYGNPDSYEVFGKRYTVLPSAKGYSERGIASWYGTKFHGRRTSSGEPYDMFAITAAHKSLPLPSYVRVTNLENGRSLIVRVNDRGPFHPGRIIDLSYTAAVRLGVYAKGSARVEVTALDPGALPSQPVTAPTPEPAPAPAPDELDRLVASLEQRVRDERSEPALPFLQFGAFRKMTDCLQLHSELAKHKLLALQVQTGSDKLCRVVQGPFATAQDADTQAQPLRELGFNPVLTYP